MRTIKFNVSYEKLISRLPALFPFIEFDKQGSSRIVKATMGEQGCYGRVVADLKYQGNPFTYTCNDGANVLVTKGIHSYRTIIDSYYKALEDATQKGEDALQALRQTDFIKFVERGIGLICVNLSSEKIDGGCGNNVKNFPLAPDYIYLGEAKTYYNKVIKIRKQLEFWKTHTETCKDDEKYYLSLKEEYEMMNGDKLFNKLGELVIQADTIATEYLNYATTAPTLHFNVNLVNTIKDLGLVSPYVEEWVAGQRYYDGDVVYYVDEYGYGMTWLCNIKNRDDVEKDDEGREYVCGKYDDESETILFDKEHWIPQTFNNLATEKIITLKGTCDSHLKSLRRYEEYINSNDQIETPALNTDWLWYYRIGTINNKDILYDENGNMAVLYSNTNDGKAHGVQAIYNDDTTIACNLKTMNKDGKEFVTNLAAWGDIITNIEATNNDNGKNELTFTYWVGAHLMAEKDIEDDKNSENYGKWYSVDDDGNYKYFFKNFIIDTESEYGRNVGVKYTETYIYYNDDREDSLYMLVDGGKFDKYVKGELDLRYVKVDDGNQNSETDIIQQYKNKEKYAFNTASNTYTYDFNVGGVNQKIPYIKTDFEAKIDITTLDFEKTPLIRYDYYNGVSYQASVNKDVNIERGVTQAFEKHIKFSEIKTFDDLETYANGGFFIMSQENINLG